MTYSVLVVDDYEPWRHYVNSALQASSRWQVVGEATDGFDAIHKAEVLRPDLILLDVGLPGTNGIEAARRILTCDPSTKILFLSENSSWDIVEAALGAGGRGYVLKSDGDRELLSAMEAIVEGSQFISASLTGHAFDVSRRQPPAPESRLQAAGHYHAVGFYSDNAYLLDDYARFAEGVLNAGSALIVLSIDSRRPKLADALRGRGIDVDRLTREGRYRWMDVGDALSRILVDDWPDETRFWSAIPPVVMQAAAASTAEDRRVAAWGECAPTLWREGKADAAIRLEHLWDELVRAYNLDTLCAYSSNGSTQCEGGSVVQRICAAHTSVDSR